MRGRINLPYSMVRSHLLDRAKFIARQRSAFCLSIWVAAAVIAQFSPPCLGGEVVSLHGPTQGRPQMIVPKTQEAPASDRDFFAWLSVRRIEPLDVKSRALLHDFLQDCHSADSSSKRGLVAAHFLQSSAKFQWNEMASFWCMLNTTILPRDLEVGFLSHISIEHRRKFIDMIETLDLGREAAKPLNRSMAVSVLRFLSQMYIDQEDDLRAPAQKILLEILGSHLEPYFSLFGEIETYNFATHLMDRVLRQSASFEDLNNSVSLQLLLLWLMQTDRTNSILNQGEREKVRGQILTFAESKLESRALISSSATSSYQFLFHLLAAAFHETGHPGAMDLIRRVIAETVDANVLTMGLIALREVAENPRASEFEIHSLKQMLRVRWSGHERINALFLPLLEPQQLTEGPQTELFSSLIVAIIMQSSWEGKALIFTKFEETHSADSARLKLFLKLLIAELKKHQAPSFVLNEERFANHWSDHLKETLNLAIEFMPRIAFQDPEILSELRRFLVDNRHLEFAPYEKREEGRPEQPHEVTQNKVWSDLVQDFLNYEASVAKKAGRADSAMSHDCNVILLDSKRSARSSAMSSDH